MALGLHRTVRAQYAQSHHADFGATSLTVALTLYYAPNSDETSLIEVGERATVSESRYDDGVELLLHRLGRCGLSRTHRCSRLADRPSSQQYG